MNQIHINEPCHENWNGMQVRGDGRWCNACEKTVFDFTNYSTEEILKVLEQKNGAKICGRCTSDKVEVPKRKISKWFASITLFLFGVSLISSCYRHVQGKMSAYEQPPSKKDLRQQRRTEAKANKNHESHFQK